MNRRTFLIGLGVTSVAVVTTAGSAWLLILTQDALCKALTPLIDSTYETTSAGQDAAALRASLIEKGVIDENGQVNHNAIQTLAATDPLIPVAGYFYTKTEIELYNLAFLLREAWGQA